ncbi:MAG: PD40 domain-containing protein [Planctomycetes bacterium]|nr:PD40 domain-containing protein [Planctomycetota bacterium]
MSTDGRVIVFDSYATNIVPSDTNSAADVFVRDMWTGTVERVSLSSSGTQGNNNSWIPVASADGRFVVFRSLANNLVPSDTNAHEDIFLRDRVAGVTTRVSVSSTGAQANQDCISPSVSADGRYIAFESTASNLVPGDLNNVADIFVHDTWTHQTTAVSVTPAGVTGNLTCRYTSISNDGRYVAFQSSASNLVLGDTNGVTDIFVRDLTLGMTERVSLGYAGQQVAAACVAPSISGDGHVVSFESAATNLVPGDTNGYMDVFVRDLVRQTTMRVSVSSTGVEGNGWSGADSGLGFTYSPLSYDGRVVAFLSAATSLVPGDTGFYWDVFTHDLTTRITEKVSEVTPGQELFIGSVAAAMSADGRWVTFTTPDATVVPGDTNADWDVFLRDRGTTPPYGYCFGDGTSGVCPCGNAGSPGRGCQNSRGTGGGELIATGAATLSADSLSFSFTGGSPTALVLLFQGAEAEEAAPFGDGLRCVGGLIKRIQARTSAGGFALFPEAGEPSISARSAIVGDPIPIGATRHYQAYYRDADPTFCPAGGTANSSQAVAVLWEP